MKTITAVTLCALLTLGPLGGSAWSYGMSGNQDQEDAQAHRTQPSAQDPAPEKASQLKVQKADNPQGDATRNEKIKLLAVFLKMFQR